MDEVINNKLAELLLRVSTIEDLLISKGTFSKEEYQTTFEEKVVKLTAMIKEQLAKENQSSLIQG